MNRPTDGLDWMDEIVRASASKLEVSNRKEGGYLLPECTSMEKPGIVAYFRRLMDDPRGWGTTDTMDWDKIFGDRREAVFGKKHPGWRPYGEVYKEAE